MEKRRERKGSNAFEINLIFFIVFSRFRKLAVQVIASLSRINSDAIRKKTRAKVFRQQKVNTTRFFLAMEVKDDEEQSN